MNKVFKKVFNAARGTMMVVNEATSSAQTGKKAALTVAVMAALVSGSTMAADWEAEGKIAVIDGNAGVTLDGVAGTAVAEEAAIFGGVKETGEANIKANVADGLNSNLTIKGNGTFEDVIGGHYAVLGTQSSSAVNNSNGAILQENADLTLGDLSLTIEGTNVNITRAVVGGTKIARNSNNGNRDMAHVNLDKDGKFQSGIVKLKTNSTNVEIFGGNFGITKDYNGTYGNPERVVAGGDYIKDIGWSMMKGRGMRIKSWREFK